jgi:aminoglycoside phosphotransferase family enzyme/predicted kinase
VDPARLLDLLSQPEAYPHPSGPVAVHHTHISAVFLAGPYAYKIKKPLDLGFLNFTTLARRRHFCLEEVRLNRRLAPSVYLGVVPVALYGGRLTVGGEGEVAEWAVWMERLPPEATLASRLGRGEVTGELLAAVAARVAAFHRGAEAGPHVDALAGWGTVARNARENFEQSEAQVGVTVTAPVFSRLRALTETVLEERRELVEDRAARGMARDTHGDLHLDHVYVFPDRPTPDDLAVVDCIEFSERFRYADPVADAAFLAMDLAFRGRRDLAVRFRTAYAEEAQDAEGLSLFPLYEAYRAAVRAKVEGLRAGEGEVPAKDREAARQSARAHWLLGLGTLEVPARRPCLLGVGGLPGAGKSTLSRGLAERAGFEVVVADRVRKELAGLPAETPAAAAFGEGLYTPEWNERTYAACLGRAEEILARGGRALVDASFREDGRRRELLDRARQWGVPGMLLLCEAGAEEVRRRLGRRRGGPSDADWAIYLRAAAAWEEPGAQTRAAVRRIASQPAPAATLAAALEALREAGLA